MVLSPPDPKRLAPRRSASVGDLACLEGTSQATSGLEKQGSTKPAAFTAARKIADQTALSALEIHPTPRGAHGYVSFCKAFAAAFPQEAKKISGIREQRSSPEGHPDGFVVRGPLALLRDIEEKIPHVEAFTGAITCLQRVRVAKPAPPACWVTLKGVTTSAAAEDILLDIQQQLGKDVQYVQRLHHTGEQGKPDFDRPLPIVRVRFVGEAVQRALQDPEFRIFGVLKVACGRAQQEPAIPHCKRCMQWGHAAKQCRRKKRCHHCGSDSHAARVCTKYSAPTTCANCQEEHPSWYKGCKAFAAAKASFLARAEANRKREQQREAARQLAEKEAKDGFQLVSSHLKPGMSFSQAAQLHTAAAEPHSCPTQDSCPANSKAPSEPITSAAAAGRRTGSKRRRQRSKSAAVQRKHAATAASQTPADEQAQETHAAQNAASQAPQQHHAAGTEAASQALQSQAAASSKPQPHAAATASQPTQQEVLPVDAAAGSEYADSGSLKEQQQRILQDILQALLSLGLSQGEEIACRLLRLVIALTRCSQPHVC